LKSSVTKGRGKKKGKRRRKPGPPDLFIRGKKKGGGGRRSDIKFILTFLLEGGRGKGKGGKGGGGPDAANCEWKKKGGRGRLFSVV